MTEDRLERILRDLRGESGRLTSARRAVVAALVDAEEHVTADDIAATVHESMPNVNQSTVYRTLDALEELGIVDHVHLGHGRAVYHLSDDRHQHLVCQDCGGVVQAPDAFFRPLAKRLLDEFGFVLEPHHFALFGKCRGCAAADSR